MKQFVQLVGIFLITLLFSASDSRSQVVKELVFSGGAELGDYQPRIIIPILTEAFYRLGIKFSARYIPSSRSLAMSNSGKTDGELHRVYNFHEVSNGKYPDLVRIDSKLLSVWLAVFSHRKDIKIERWEDLKNYNVIYYRGRQNVKNQLEKYLPKEQIYEVTTDKAAFNMLSKKRADIVISESHEGQILIESSTNLANIQEIGRLEETLIYSYINKRHESLAPLVAKTIERMKQDGTYATIVNQFNK